MRQRKAPMDLTSEILDVRHFPTIAVPHPDILEPSILRDPKQTQLKNTAIDLIWVDKVTGYRELRTIYTYQ